MVVERLINGDEYGKLGVWVEALGLDIVGFSFMGSYSKS